MSNGNDQKLLNTVLKIIKEKPKEALNGNITVEHLENRQIVKLLNEGNYKELSRFYPKITKPLKQLKDDIDNAQDELKEKEDNVKDIEQKIEELKRELDNSNISIGRKEDHKRIE